MAGCPSSQKDLLGIIFYMMVKKINLIVSPDRDLHGGSARVKLEGPECGDHLVSRALEEA